MNKYRLYLLLGVIIYNLIDYTYIYVYERISLSHSLLACTFQNCMSIKNTFYDGNITLSLTSVHHHRRHTLRESCQLTQDNKADDRDNAEANETDDTVHSAVLPKHTPANLDCMLMEVMCP